MILELKIKQGEEILNTMPFDLQEYSYKIDVRGDQRQGFTLSRAIIEDALNLRTLEFYRIIAEYVRDNTEIICEIYLENNVIESFAPIRASYYIEGVANGITQIEYLELEY